MADLLGPSTPDCETMPGTELRDLDGIMTVFVDGVDFLSIGRRDLMVDTLFQRPPIKIYYIAI